MTIVACGGGIGLPVELGCCGTSACKPVDRCSITTTMKTMMSTSRTSIRGVTFIFGPVEDEPPPVVENAIASSSRCMENRHARVCIIGHLDGAESSTAQRSLEAIS